MNIKVYKYGIVTALSRLILNAFSVLYFLVGLIGFVWIPISSLIKQNSNQISFLSLLGGFIGWSIWSPFIFLFMANLLSDITVTEDGLSTKFLWFRCDAKWNSIVDVKVRTGWFKKQTILILTKNGLTSFHHVFGILYGRTNLPALMIFSSIKDFDLLKREILFRWKKNRALVNP